MDSQVEIYLTAAEVSERFGGQLSVRTLANWRSSGIGSGPPFVKLGGKVLYPLSQLREWERRRTVTSTAQYSR